MRDEDKKTEEFFPEPLTPEEEADALAKEDIEEMPEAEEDKRSWGDRLIKNTSRYRYETVAHLAATGMQQNEIAKQIGMTPAWVSTVMSTTYVKQKTKEIQEKYWGGSIEKRFKQSVPKAFGVMEEVMVTSEKDNVRLDAAKWLLEKVTGKATQSVNVESNSLTDLLTALKNMDEQEAAERQVNEDVLEIEGRSLGPGDASKYGEEKQKKPVDPMDEWINANVPVHKGVGSREK